MEDDGRAKKRVRVSMACKECRQRKTRCDGKHPSCQRCEDGGLTCSYDPPAMERVARRSRSMELLSRVRDLECALESFTKASYGDGDTSSNGREHRGAISGSHHGHGHPKRHSIPENNRAWEEERQDNVDGMGTITLSESGTSTSYFGPSSSLALVRELSLALYTLRNRQQPGRACHISSLSSTRQGSTETSRNYSIPRLYPESPVPQDIGPGCLPPEPEATILLQEYFGTVGLFFPCIHRDTFLATYTNFRDNAPGRRSHSWLALLFMIFAVMYQTRTSFAPPPDAVDEKSQRYFRMALKLAMPDAITHSNLETVQMLCLSTCYLQCSTSPAETWSFHVLAVKGAMQIGLQAQEASKDLPLQQRELRKRTWFWCVINDALISTYLGRPPVVPKPLITTKDRPEDISDILPTSGQSRVAIATSIVYYNAMIQLSILLSEILSQLYGDNTNPTKDRGVFETLHLALDLSWRLSTWRRSVPVEIRPPESAGDPSSSTNSLPIQVERFQTGLSILFYVAHFLVHRPVLLHLLQFESDGPDADETLSLLRDAGFGSMKKCIRTCNRSIALGKKIVYSRFNESFLWGAWWMTNFLTFNASMMQFTALLIDAKPPFSDLMTPGDINLIRGDLEDVIQIQDRLDGQNRIVSRCRECLHGFLEAYDSMKLTTSADPFGGWEESTASMHNADLPSLTATETGALPTSIFERGENGFAWGDVEAFPGALATDMATDLLFHA